MKICFHWFLVVDEPIVMRFARVDCNFCEASFTKGHSQENLIVLSAEDPLQLKPD